MTVVSVEPQAVTFLVAPATAREVGKKAALGDDGLATRRCVLVFACYFVLFAIFLFWLENIVPDRIAVTFFGKVFTIGNIRHHFINAGLLGCFIAPAAFLIELLFTGWRHSSVRHFLLERSRSSRSDLVVFLLWQTHAMNIVRTVLTFGTALFSGLWIHDQLLAATGVELSFNWLPVPLAFIAYLVGYTFFDYWTHRMDHSRYFWPTHRYHHSAEEFFVITSDRGNPAAISASLANTIPLGILGMSAQTGFWIYVLVAAHHLIIHSRIDSDFGWIGRYVLQSPVHHRLHHIRDTSRPTAHYSLLPLWDHLFGSWQGGGSQQIVIGVEYPYRHGFWVFSDIWRDYKEFIAGFIRRREA
jgi:sterol desaturase/sphingolipid hydroxylase (fatty acid hydroxylase superfamily)